MLNPVIAIIHNTKLNRWHPVYFLESPLPGPDTPDKPVRHKSKGHHTPGFDTRQEALTFANTTLVEALKPTAIGPISFALENDFSWDGEGVPALVFFFGIKEHKLAAEL